MLTPLGVSFKVKSSKRRQKMNFMKSFSRENTSYYVTSGRKIIGRVRRVEAWVVRGGRTEWEASRAGEYLGTFGTRNEAAAYLEATK
jgi:hypothetical protein